MTAVEAMKRELSRIQFEMSQCVNDAGFIKAGERYRYQGLVEDAKKFKEGIDWFQENFPVKKV